MADRGFGKILEIDLATERIQAKDLDTKIIRDFIGGLGLGMKMLYDEVGPDVDPGSPKNILVIAPGPLTGTDAPSNSRTHVVTKSPYTGLVGIGNFGGYFGARLRFTGCEGLVIRNKSSEPVYILVDDEEVHVKSAKHLWGKDAWETTDILRKEWGDEISVLAIGQAGENLVKFSCPIADYYHAPGRSHTGYVMGDKKLKAIAVRAIRRPVHIADYKAFMNAVQEAIARISTHPEWEPAKRTTAGSQYGIKVYADRGMLRSGIFGRQEFPEDSEIRLLPESMLKHSTLVPRSCCYQCAMGMYYGCDLWADVKDGPYAGTKLVGTSFSLTGREWGWVQGVKSYPAIWKCKELCNRYGIDQLTPIPFAMELLDRGVVTKEDLDGIDLRVGNESAIMKMLTKIAFREGIGDLLAEGSVKAAKAIGKGAEKYLHTIKGMEVMTADPRLLPTDKILGYIVSPRGGDDVPTTHAFLSGYPYWAPELGWEKEDYLKWRLSFLEMTDDERKNIFGSSPSPEVLDPRRIEGRAAMVKWHEQVTTLADTLGLCLFATEVWGAIGPKLCAKFYSAVLGSEVTSEELMRSGDRIFNLMKAYIVREGWKREDDDWPKLFYEEPYPGEVGKGALLSRPEVERLLDEYYEVRGWDKKTGMPKKGTLVALGLEDVAEELSGMGLIPA